MNLSPPRSPLRIALPVLAVALFLRLLPADYGLPHTYRYDESRYVLLAGKVGTEGPRIRDYGYGPLFPYLTAGAYGALYVGGRTTGRYENRADFRTEYYRDPSPFFRIARILSAALGALAVLALLRATAWWTGLPPRRRRVIQEGSPSEAPWGGLLAAGALAVLPVPVLLGAQARAESLLLLLLALWLWGAGRFAMRGGRRDLALAGVALGLAVTAKYNAVFFLPWQMGLVLLAPDPGTRRSLRSWSAALLAPLAGVFLGAPLAWLEPRMAWLGFRFNLLVSSTDGSPVTGLLRNLEAFLTGDGGGGLGIVLGTLAAMGTVIALARLRGYGLWLATAGWGFVLATGLAHGEPVPRYLIPAYPPLLVLAGMVLDWLGRETPLRDLRPPTWLPSATAIALLVPALIRTGGEELRLQREDTRTAAARWIESHLPAGSSVLLEDGVASPPLVPVPAAVPRDPRGEGRAGALSRSGTGFDLHWLPVPWGMATEDEARAVAFDRHELPGFDPADREKLTLGFWKNRGVTHAAISSTVYGRYFDTESGSLLPYRDFYRALRERGTLLHREDPDRGDRPGPLILIYRII